MKKNKYTLITGVAGFIGMHLCEKLLKNGEKIIGIDNLNNYYDNNLKKERLKILNKYKNFEFVKTDFSIYKNLLKVLEKKEINKIIHLGAQAGVRYSITNPDVYINTNYVGTFNILEYARQKKIKEIIIASSSSVYGEINTNKKSKEKDNTDYPVSIYAATKKATEVLSYSYSKLFNIKIVLLRFFTVYGPWGRPDMAYFKFTKNINQDKDIIVYNNGEMARSYTYIDDVINGIINCFNLKEKYSIYNLAGDKKVKLLDFIKIIEKKLNKKARIKFERKPLGDVKDTFGDISLSKKDIKYLPSTSIEEGLNNFVDWYIKNEKLLNKLKD